MDTISFEGEKYVKASSIAKELGYTADYVGQLARAKKISAKLVGRTWYVKDSSIRSHKTSRYRSSTEKSKQEIKKVIDRGENNQVHHGLNQTFSYLKKANHPTIKYETDDGDLIPLITEKNEEEKKLTTKNLAVNLADAEKVKVESTAKPYNILTSDLPRITFKGKLNIVDSETAQAEEKPQRSATLKIGKYEPKVVEVSGKNAKAINITKPRRSKGFHISVFEDEEDEELIPIHVVKKSDEKLHFLHITTKYLLVTVLALGVFVLAATIDNTVITSKYGVDTKYELNYKTLIYLKNTLLNIDISY